MPSIEIIYTDIPDEHAPLGARGVGEIGVTGAAATMANAVYHATSKRVHDPPITPDKLIKLEEQEHAGDTVPDS